jgi:hypothetical protein
MLDFLSNVAVAAVHVLVGKPYCHRGWTFARTFSQLSTGAFSVTKSLLVLVESGVWSCYSPDHVISTKKQLALRADVIIRHSLLNKLHHTVHIPHITTPLLLLASLAHFIHSFWCIEQQCLPDRRFSVVSCSVRLQSEHSMHQYSQTMRLTWPIHLLVVTVSLHDRSNRHSILDSGMVCCMGIYELILSWWRTGIRNGVGSWFRHISRSRCYSHQHSVHVDVLKWCCSTWYSSRRMQ